MSRWCIPLDGSVVPDRDEIGNKAFGIATMRSHGLPVPSAFVVPTHVGRELDDAGALPDAVWAEIVASLAVLEQETARTFGGTAAPLLVSVRSGAAVSMPGMMDTILDLGINDGVERALARQTGDAAFAADTHRRFVESYAKIVLDGAGEVPHDVHEQLRGAVHAVLRSWDSPRARAYRDHWRMSHDGGTAVVVQAMVFGNLSDDSGTGVFFTRNPHSGAGEPYGEFLPRGQGEDVVSGEADPLDIAELAARLPAVHDELLRAGATLERLAADVQDIEFTIEDGRLYLLQTRAAKRSPEAALRIAVEMTREEMITPTDALGRITAEHVIAVLEPHLDETAREQATLLAKGEPACPGFASGMLVCDPDEALDRSEDGPVILGRHTTSPDDVRGMIAAEGICTEVGGRTSHAAVVSRELGRPAVVGCGPDTITTHAGRPVTIDGSTGEVFDGILPTVQADPAEHEALSQLAAWAGEHPDVLPADHPLRDLTARAAALAARPEG